MAAPFPVMPTRVPPPGRGPRPGTVLVAGLITILGSLAALGLLMLLLAVMLVGASDSPVVEESSDDLANRAILAGLIVWSLLGLGLGVAVLWGSAAARILLVVSSVGVAGLALRSMGNVLLVPWLLAAVAVVALLFTGGANAWFARRSGG